MPIRTVIEPFRIKSVEPIRWTSRKEQEEILARAHCRSSDISRRA